MCGYVLVLSQKKQHNPVCIWQLPLICVLPAREKSISKDICQLTYLIGIEVAQTEAVVPGLWFTIVVMGPCIFSLTVSGMRYPRLPFFMGKRRSRGCELSRH